jgi:alpha-beta hydrolase superfamily lysophospholipase/SAM-dependent methyltransferase
MNDLPSPETVADLRGPSAPGVPECSTDHFPGSDQTPLFYRAWLPNGGDAAIQRAILLLHRGHEHSARWAETAEALAGPETAVFAWDARGHGRSPGERGDAENVGVYVKDLDAFARHIAGKHGIAWEKMAVVAHSVGAVVAATWAHDFAPPIRALVLATPAFRVKLYVPLAMPGLRLLDRVRPGSFIKSYVGGKLLTHDPAQAAGYDADPLVSKQISVRVLLDLYDTATRLLADAGAIRTPTLVLAAGSDAVVRRGPQRTFFERLSSPLKEFEVLAGFSHAIFHERERRRAVEKVRGFIDRAFGAVPESSSALLDADQRGYTKSEYERLRSPLPKFSPSSLNFAAQRAGLRTLLRLSEGVRIGWRTGFDSGQSLDYVYENQPRGATFLGRLIDRQYLDAIGWRGIRQRRANLERMLADAIRRQHEAGQPVRLLDIAAGPGRYLLETIAHFPEIKMTARLRDRSETALAAGRALAGQLGLSKVATYEIGDAFDEAALAAITPRPTVAIVSGLYELFADNAPVLASLRGLRAALADDGELIYTNQPWHPQVEMIARTLTNRDGQPWIMRRRTQAEMDALVRAAGFEKTAMEIDRWGIFTVSAARKRRPDLLPV